MSNLIMPNPVPELNSQMSGDRNALYVLRPRNVILMPTGFGNTMGQPNWQGGFTMANGYYGLDYVEEWVMDNVVSPVVYSLSSGSLPPGLSLSAVGQVGGRISGRPTSLGVFNFHLLATNSVGNADQTFSITVNPVPVSGFV